MSLSIQLYSAKFYNQWNNFLNIAKNRHFFFNRDYMEYNSNKFNDFSLIVFNESGNIIALLPANIDNNIVYSHQGLTFGGFIIDDKMKMELMIEVFNLIIDFLKKNNIRKLIYKCIPYIYHTKPSEEDRYALFINNACLIRRDVSSTIYLDKEIRYSKGRKWSINRAKKESVEIISSRDIESFWELLEKVLVTNHNAKPVHSLTSIKYLFELFPYNIKLYLVKKNGETISGALVYENVDIVHTQYLANNNLGREIGALDLLIDYLIKEIYRNKKYFDFGISNEQAGRFLNTGLIAQKEGFGAKAVVHDFYEITL